MLPVIAFAALSQSLPQIPRDSFGVAHVRADSTDQAFFDAGLAVAQDRMWQMEQSRRLARGKLAEAFGPQFEASDREVLQTGYTDEELQAQFDKLSPISKAAIEAYSKGVNAFLADPKNLPPGYAATGLKPAPWTPLDSVAIAIRLFQQFGRGGAGELRNMALLGYLGTRPKLKGRVLDAVDDFEWENDPASPTTVAPEDDMPAAVRPKFYLPDRKTTEAHVGMLPKLGLLELLPAIRLASREESNRVAENLALPFKAGSYCIVVSQKRSAEGVATLLSGPQMGFRLPSIVHEMSIVAPGLRMVGMDLPGVPGVLVGHTAKVAWGLTSGVDDTDDIVYYKTAADSGYVVDGVTQQLQRVTRTLNIKGADPKQVTELRTVDGPVILSSKGSQSIFARKSSYAGREMESYDAVTSLWQASSVADVDQAIRKATMSFNFFFATAPSGAEPSHIGFRYCGLAPLRAPGFDPRFPIPGGKSAAWSGFVPADQMPHVLDPKAGLITNWNNKPVSWWPNFDTPAWGSLQRVNALREALPKGPISLANVEMGPWTIARRVPPGNYEYEYPAVEPLLRSSLASVDSVAARLVRGYDGWMLDGAQSPTVYETTLDALREEIFVPTVGNFLSADNLRLVAQSALMIRVLRHKTKFDYLEGRKPEDVVRAAFTRAVNALTTRDPRPYGAWRMGAPSMVFGDQPPVPYSNRGTYIQVVQMFPTIIGRNVLPPGVAESGPHEFDQLPLSRAWVYKPMTFGPAD